MSDILSIAKKLNKSYSDDNLIVKGDIIPDYELMPTGALASDYSLKGGLPYGRIISISGKEHSGKTTYACLQMATYQKAHPDKMCVFVDVEHSLDKDFQAHMTGLDLDRLLYISPDRLGAEQIFDIIIELQQADNIGLIVLDSVPALISMKVLEGDLEKNYGMSGHVAASLANFLKKMIGLVSAAGNMLILVNQVRESPLPTGAIQYNEPGGHGPKYYPSVKVRCGTRKFIKDGSETTKGEGATGFRLNFVITKNKVNDVRFGGGYVTFDYDTGVDYTSDAIDVAINAQLIERPTMQKYVIVDLNTREPYINEDGEVLEFVGKAKLIDYFNTHPEFTKQYVKDVTAFLTGKQTEQHLTLLDKDTLDEIMTEEDSVK